MFNLKVILNESGSYVSDTRHVYGGTDTLQAAAFLHLFPEGFCPWVDREQLFFMASIHGWEVTIAESESV